MRKVGVLSFLAGLLLVLAACHPADSDACEAGDYASLQGCIDGQVAGEALSIALTADIELDVGETVRVLGRSDVVIDGQHHEIFETVDRAADTGTGSRYYMRIGNGSDNIRLHHLSFGDHRSTPSTMGEDCRAQNGVTGASWIDGPCDGLIALGVGSAGVSEVELDGLVVNSEKAKHVALQTVTGLTVSDSTFHDASVFSFHFLEHLPKGDVAFVGNTFRRTGANSIIAVNVDGLTVHNNNFFDNHNDMQWHVCSNNPCPGGQVLFIAKANAPVSDASIVGNRFDIDYPAESPLLQSATGIEIHSKPGGVFTGLVVEDNQIDNLGRQGIQAHLDTGVLEGRIANNTLTNNGRSFGWGEAEVERYVSLNNNPDVEADNNQVSTTGGVVRRGTFLDTPDTCTIGATGECTVAVEWLIEDIPAGAQPVVRVDDNPNPFHRPLNFGTSWQFTKEAPWIGPRQYTFRLYLDESDTAPLAVKHVRGV